MDFPEAYGFMVIGTDGEVSGGQATLESLRRFYPTAKVVVVDAKSEPTDIPWVDARTTIVRIPDVRPVQLWHAMYTGRWFACGVLLRAGTVIGAPLPVFSEPCFLATERVGDKVVARNCVAILPWEALASVSPDDSDESFSDKVAPWVKKLYAS